MSRAKTGAALLLTLAALIWGTAFVAQSLGMEYVGPCAFNAARSFIGSLALLPVIFAGDRLRAGKSTEEEKRPTPGPTRPCWRAGRCAGCFCRRRACCSRRGFNTPRRGRRGSLPPSIS